MNPSSGLPARLPSNVRAAITEAKARIAALYGDRLDRIVLYGSHARGDARSDSDVDLLVVLGGKVEPYAEMKPISAVRLDLSIRYGVDVSMQPYAASEVVNPVSPFLQNVVEDGLSL